MRYGSVILIIGVITITIVLIINVNRSRPVQPTAPKETELQPIRTNEVYRDNQPEPQRQSIKFVSYLPDERYAVGYRPYY